MKLTMKESDNEKGFTLVEILIYTAILTIVAGLMTGILLTTTQVQQRESSSNEVTSQLNFAMQTIQRLVRQSSVIEIGAGVATSTLKLRMEDPAKDPTCISLSSSTIKLAEGPDAVNPQNCTANTSDLTSDRVVVNDLTFKKFTQYPSHDSVSINLTISSNTQDPKAQVQRTLQSAIARVSAATFDSDVVPGSAYDFNLGQSGAPWQKIIMSDGTAANPSYTFGNDSSLGIFKVSGSSTLGFSTQGIERMRIDASGNVNVNSNKIINLADPVNSQDAATRAYVLANAAGGDATLANQTTILSKLTPRGPAVAMSAESATSTYAHANAAKYCYDLSAVAEVAMDGNTTTTYTDWRLPTVGEAAVFEGTVTSANYIWTGTVYEAANGTWLRLRFSDGHWYYGTYDTGYYARCVR